MEQQVIFIANNMVRKVFSGHPRIGFIAHNSHFITSLRMKPTHMRGQSQENYKEAKSDSGLLLLELSDL
jgi:hypothetical protein